MTRLMIAAAAFAGLAPAQHDSALEILHVQANVYMLAGPQGNSAVQIGPSGVTIVDTQDAQTADALLPTIRTLSDKVIKYAVNTSADPHHTGGNTVLTALGGPLLTIRGTPGGSRSDEVKVIAHENVLNRMSAPTGSQSPTPFEAWPTDTYFIGPKEVYYNGEAVQIFHVPAAHTDGDSIVYFRKSDVVVAGDIFVTDNYPEIDIENGGSVQGVIDGLNLILDLAIPAHHEEGGTYVIPGRGRICDEFDVVEYRDMVTIVRDRVQDMISKDMTIEQIQAAQPTLDWEPRYGSTTGAWTTAKFVEAVYKSLTQQ